MPSLAEVACIDSELPDDKNQMEMIDLHSYGRIVPFAPVQITDVLERPGAQLIKWEQVSFSEIICNPFSTYNLISLHIGNTCTFCN